ncbi:MAG: hypothetical protein JWS11_2200, partial [Cypionkella sp.]|nr:hypothetical protein [Cypionkella sp.]
FHLNPTPNLDLASPTCFNPNETTAGTHAQIPHPD